MVWFVLMIVAIVFFISASLFMYSVGVNNKNFDIEMYKNERLDYFINTNNYALIRFIGNKPTIFQLYEVNPIQATTRYIEQTSIIKEDRNGLITVYVGGMILVYEDRNKFFEEWRIVNGEC